AGSCTDGDSVQLYDGANAVGSAVVCSSGSSASRQAGATRATSAGSAYNITLSNLAEGTHAIAMTATRNGIESAKSAATTVTIDRMPPSAPAVNGFVSPATLTATVFGLAEPGAIVTVRDSGQFLCADVADNAANWDCYGAPAGSGTRHVTATASDLAG